MIRLGNVRGSIGFGSVASRLAKWILKKDGIALVRYRPELHYMRGPGPRSREKLELESKGLAKSQVGDR
jgi:hypothetical protein